MSEFRIDPAFESLIPPLAPDESALLEQSIKAEGCRDPLVVWNGILLDGHNRKRICDKLGTAYQTRNIDLPDLLAAKIWIRENQSGRRNLTDDQRAINAAALMELLAERAKTERAKAGRAAGGDATPEQKANRLVADVSTKRSGSDQQSRSRVKAAKSQGVSERKVRQAGQVRKSDPELAQRVFNGDMPLAAAVREIKRREVKDNLESVAVQEAKAVEGVYDVIVIDPPWPMQKIERDCRPNQSEFDYPTMTEAELAELPIPTADACHVWLWTTHKFLPMALRLLDEWGLKYVCTFVWHKPGGFQPIGLPQYNCEFALYARKGSPSFLDTKAFPACFNAPRGAHSEKPEAFYDVVRRVTGGRRLDMFNRRKIDGFTGWGKEAE
jgi:N6-adenosine-specific RNA methylase IME4